MTCGAKLNCGTTGELETKGISVHPLVAKEEGLIIAGCALTDAWQTERAPPVILTIFFLPSDHFLPVLLTIVGYSSVRTGRVMFRHFQDLSRRHFYSTY